jgi:hypothetical protein
MTLIDLKVQLDRIEGKLDALLEIQSVVIGRKLKPPQAQPDPSLGQAQGFRPVPELPSSPPAAE